jgi:hypothetical protein
MLHCCRRSQLAAVTPVRQVKQKCVNCRPNEKQELEKKANAIAATLDVKWPGQTTSNMVSLQALELMKSSA